MTIDDLHKLLLDHVRPPHFELLERANFHKITRETNETMRNFLLRLQQQASRCGFGDQLKTKIRDRIVAGVNNTDIEKKLLIPDLTMEKAQEILLESHNLSQAVGNDPVLLSNTYKNKQYIYNKNKSFMDHFKKQTPSPAAPQKSTGKCFSCGGPHFRNVCKFRTAVCRQCKKTGHIAKVCRSNATKITSVEDNESINRCFLTKKGNYLWEKVGIENKLFDFTVESGSPVSVISSSMYYTSKKI